MKIRKLSSLIGLSAVFLIGPLTAAQAQRPGLYFGGAWGAYSIKKSNLDDNDDVIKGYVGGQILPWLAIEGSISDFNRLNNVNGERFEADGRGLAALFSIPLGTTSTAFAKVGQFPRGDFLFPFVEQWPTDGARSEVGHVLILRQSVDGLF